MRWGIGSVCGSESRFTAHRCARGTAVVLKRLVEGARVSQSDEYRRDRAWSRRSIARGAAVLPLVALAACSSGGEDNPEETGLVAIPIEGRGDPSLDTQVLGDGLKKAADARVPAVLKGKFHLLGTVVLPDGAVVVGYGAVIRQLAPRTVTLRTAGARIRILGVRIEGRSDDYVNSSGVFASAGIEVSSGSRDIKITDCDIRRATGAGVLISGGEDIDILGCTFVGAGAGAIKGTTYNYSAGIVAHGTNASWSAENNDISGFAQGIVTGPSQTNFRIMGNRIHDIPGQHGMYLESVNRGVIHGNVVWNTGLNGLKIQVPPVPARPALDLVITGNVFEALGDSGIVLTNYHSSTTARLRQMVLASNVVDGSGADGILVIGVADVVVHDNVVHDAGRHGLSIRGCAGVDAHHNRIDTCSADGISVVDSTDWSLDSNRVRNAGQTTPGYGIRIDDASRDGVVRANKLSDSTGSMRSALAIGAGGGGRPSASVHVVSNVGTNGVPVSEQ